MACVNFMAVSMIKLKTEGLGTGVLFKILNLNLFCILSVALFKVGGAVPMPVVFLCLNIIGITILLPVAIYQKFSFSVLFRNYRTFLLRGLFNSVGVCSWVFAMQYLGPNEATAITFTIPILTLFLSAIFCADRFHYNIVLAILACIVGATIIIYPKLNMEFTMLGCCYALVSSCCWAMYDVICKIQSKVEGAFIQTFKNDIYSAFVVSAFLAFVFKINPVSYTPLIVENAQYILLAGVAALLNITALFCAYRATKVSNLMPLGYLRLFFMSIYMYFLFGHVVHVNTIVGGTIIFFTNFFVFRFNLKRAALEQK